MFPFFLPHLFTAALHPQAAGRLANGADSSLFYWLTPARNGNASAPLLVWLNGGPGSSSMMGLFMELGPYTLLADGSGLGPPRAASWNAEFNVVFVDQPAGTGFSVATSDAGYVNNQSEVGTSFVAFLLAFYEAHPELTANELWLTGESYAGKYIPAIANAILAGGDATSGINFQGVAIGNGLTRPREMTLSVAASFFAVGVIDGAQRDAAQALALAAVAHIDAANWTAATAARSTLFDYLEQCNGKDSFPNVGASLAYSCSRLLACRSCSPLLTLLTSLLSLSLSLSLPQITLKSTESTTRARWQGFSTPRRPKRRFTSRATRFGRSTPMRSTRTWQRTS